MFSVLIVLPYSRAARTCWMVKFLSRKKFFHFSKTSFFVFVPDKLLRVAPFQRSILVSSIITKQIFRVFIWGLIQKTCQKINSIWSHGLTELQWEIYWWIDPLPVHATYVRCFINLLAAWQNSNITLVVRFEICIRWILLFKRYYFTVLYKTSMNVNRPYWKEGLCMN